MAIAGIIAFYKEFFDGLVTDQIISITFLGFFGLYFFLAHILTRSKWERKSRYPEVFEKLNRGFKEIHHLDRTKEDVKKEVVVKSFQHLCNFLASTFSELTGTKCSACIKILTPTDDDELVYETLCRNLDVDQSRINADIKTIKENIKHTFSDNTAFKEADHNDEGYFICNRLPFWVGYENTSSKIYGEPYIGLNIFMRFWKWKFPYKSAIVVPIIPLNNAATKADIYGYLCVDSPAMGVFDHEYDTSIMRGVADGIYNTFVKFKDVV